MRDDADGKARRRRGFSLIELVVVIAIITTLTLAIVPQLGGTRDDAVLRAAARELSAALGLAYSQAVTLGEDHRLRIDERGSRWAVEPAVPVEEEAPAAGAAPPRRDAPETSGRIDPRISVRVSGGERADSILLRADGTAEAGELLLLEREGPGLRLRVDPTTARVRAVPVEGSARP